MGHTFVSFFLLLFSLCKTTVADDYLANWMGQLSLAFESSSILDMSLPGTHDTLTYDLSTIISDGGIDGHDDLSIFLNAFSNLDDNLNALEFARVQAQSQGLNITEQLEVGVRFLDLRVMFTDNDWYSLHCVQSNQLAMVYLTEIHDWMLTHPTEIVVMWISKHGSQCATGQDAYPKVDIDTKQAFWADVESLFSDIIMDSTLASINETTYPELISQNFRAVFFVSDYAEFSNSTRYAIDGCRLDNGGSSTIGTDVDDDSSLLYNAEDHRNTDKQQGKFWLLSMANSPPGDAIGYAAKIALDPSLTHPEKLISECASQYPITNGNFTNWCPASLLDVGQLTAYYKQQSLQNAWNSQSALPHAIYIDAVAPGGYIRTGTRKLSDQSQDPICDTFIWSECQSTTDALTCPDGYTSNGDTSKYETYNSDGTTQSSCSLTSKQVHGRCCRNADNDHAEDGFGYVQLMIATNARRGCSMMSQDDPNYNDCLTLVEQTAAMFEQSNATQWSDIETGRTSSL